MGSSEARALNQIITETKLFHFHRIFKNGGGGGAEVRGGGFKRSPGHCKLTQK